MPLSIEGSRTGRKYQETFRNFRPKSKGLATKLFEESSGASALPLPTSRQGSEYYAHCSPSSGSYKTVKEPLDLSPFGSTGSSRGGSRGGSRSNERHFLASGGKLTKSVHEQRSTKERRPGKSRGERRPTSSRSRGGEGRPSSRSKFSERSIEKLEISPPSTSTVERSLESITLSDYMSNLLKKSAQNKSRQSTPQSDLGDDDVRPQSVEHMEMQYDIEDNNRLRNIMSRGASRKAKQQNWVKKEIEMDFRPATASDRIARNEVYDSDPHLSIDNVTTKEVDLSALSADFFSPTKKKPPSAKIRSQGGEDDLLPVRPPSRDPDMIDRSRRKPQSARAMLEGWQKKMNEMERPPSRQRPPPESLHLYAEGFATRISNVKRPSTAVSPSRHNRQSQNESDPKVFAAYYKKKDSQSLRENLRHSTIKYSSYEGDSSTRAPSRQSRRGRKKRVKEAFTNS